MSLGYSKLCLQLRSKVWICFDRVTHFSYRIRRVKRTSTHNPVHTQLHAHSCAQQPANGECLYQALLSVCLWLSAPGAGLQIHSKSPQRRAVVAVAKPLRPCSAHARSASLVSRRCLRGPCFHVPQLNGAKCKAWTLVESSWPATSLYHAEISEISRHMVNPCSFESRGWP